MSPNPRERFAGRADSSLKAGRGKVGGEVSAKSRLDEDATRLPRCITALPNRLTRRSRRSQLRLAVDENTVRNLSAA